MLWPCGRAEYMENVDEFGFTSSAMDLHNMIIQAMFNDGGADDGAEDGGDGG